MPADPAPSLAARVASIVAARDVGRSTRAGVAVALLLTAAPLGVWAGARWTEAGVRRDLAAIRETARPRLAVLAARDRARLDLAAALAVPGTATTLDGLAGALPVDAALARATRGVGGRLTVELQTADPDRLRAALRRRPATAGLRDAGQRRGEGAMTVMLEEAR